MKIDFDPAKRAWTLAARSLDFRDAAIVFEGRHLTEQDIRRDYGEQRFMTIGRVGGLIVVIGWTPRMVDLEMVRRIFSMRRANEKESASYLERFGSSRDDTRRP
jgi:hypothetical protein